MTTGCLCLHGFTGSPWELEPLAERLRKKYRWLVYTPVLPGHNENENLKEVSYKTWIYKADLAARELFLHCDQVYVIGFSMGGMLASYIAARYPVAKVVLLGAAAQYIGAGQLMKDMAEMLESGIKGQMKKHPWYPIFYEKVHTPLHAVREFQKAVKAVTPFLKDVTVPVFIGQGVQDGLVPRRSAQFLYEKMTMPVKKLYFYEQSKHFLCHGANSEQVMEDVENFLIDDIPDGEIVWKSAY
ncbi:Esterase/lipase [Alteribacillus persepolensis]|uniref:Esterase/lipase n=1 Tax=Alteribacillus persepolensis TaxID=568899 RepID=A0A1G8AKR3_9BACI|nr:alpha/beta fold hydrolase [Alteribacillus persepolensis]SDH21507.1 Esterase/lipase [Alteribacillus persepolensis]